MLSHVPAVPRVLREGASSKRGCVEEDEQSLPSLIHCHLYRRREGAAIMLGSPEDRVPSAGEPRSRRGEQNGALFINQKQEDPPWMAQLSWHVYVSGLPYSRWTLRHSFCVLPHSYLKGMNICFRERGESFIK